MKRTIALMAAAALLLGMFTGCRMRGLEPAAEPEAHVALNESLIGKALPAAETFAGGSGTEENPYLIETAPQLVLMMDRISESDSENRDDEAFYQLTADIALNDTEGWETWGETAPEYQWYPNRRSFAGVLDGGGHTITGLYCYGPIHPKEGADSLGLGLFDNMSRGEIRNLTIAESYIHTMDTAHCGMFVASGSEIRLSGCVNEGIVSGPDSGKCGGIAGNVSGSLENCINRGTVYGHGGVAGICFGSMVGCENEGAVTNSQNFSWVGGIAGSFHTALSGAEALSAKDCVNRGSVTGKCDAGGLFGYVYHTRELGEIQNCSNFGTVCGEGYIGGLFGDLESRKDAETVLRVSGCTNEGAVSADREEDSDGSLGGIAGSVRASDDASLVLEDCTNRGTLTGAGAENDTVIGGILAGVTTLEEAHVTLRHCVNEADLENFNGGSMGGIISMMSVTGGNSAGTSVQLHQCENHGDLTGEVYGHGGIVGITTILNWNDDSLLEFDGCRNTGDLYCRSAGNILYLGGINGAFLYQNDSTGAIRFLNCVNEGNITFDIGNRETTEEMDSAMEFCPAFADGIVPDYPARTEMVNCTSTGTTESVNGDPRFLYVGQTISDEEGNVTLEPGENGAEAAPDAQRPAEP